MPPPASDFNISEASHQQSESIQDVAGHIGDITQVTQSNSATAQEVSSTSETLASAAEVFKEMVGRYKLKR